MNQIEKIIDIATWNRREHYEHFSAFDDPFFGLSCNSWGIKFSQFPSCIYLC